MLVLIPRLAVFGALILAMTMACAIATHLTLIGGNPVPAIVLLALNLVVLWMRRGTVSALVGRR